MNYIPNRSIYAREFLSKLTSRITRALGIKKLSFLLIHLIERMFFFLWIKFVDVSYIIVGIIARNMGVVHDNVALLESRHSVSYHPSRLHKGKYNYHNCTTYDTILYHTAWRTEKPLSYPVNISRQFMSLSKYIDFISYILQYTYFPYVRINNEQDNCKAKKIVNNLL